MFNSEDFTHETSTLISAAFSKNSWSSIESGYNNFREFCKTDPYMKPIPLSQNIVSRYVHWLSSVKNLKHTSVVTYVNYLSTILKLKGEDVTFLHSYTTKTMLTVIKMSQTTTVAPTPTRKVMTIHLLKILGHEISISNWELDSKRVVWTASCVLFFGSFRVGEILSTNENSFDKTSCLLWGDLKFESESILIHLKSPKVMKNVGGDFVDVFKMKGSTCCPVEALKGLKENGVFKNDLEKPVFAFSSGKLLTPAVFNSTIRTLLRPHLGSLSSEFSSHSFRAGIPSALAMHPDTGLKDQIKGWGRWDSDCYQRYTRLRHDQRKTIHDKVCQLLKF
jgi:hypothetical protein